MSFFSKFILWALLILMLKDVDQAFNADKMQDAIQQEVPNDPKA
jgi:hypothetical protein